MASHKLIKPSAALVKDLLSEWELLSSERLGNTIPTLAYKYDLTHEEAHAIADGSETPHKFVTDIAIAAALQANAASLKLICALGSHRGVTVVGTFFSGPHIVPHFGS